MSFSAVVDEVIATLRRRYGKREQAGRSNRLWKFGHTLVIDPVFWTTG